MNKLLLTLLNAPMAFSIFLPLLIVSPAIANEMTAQTPNSPTCRQVSRFSNLSCTRASETMVAEVGIPIPVEGPTEAVLELPMLEFTIEESDTAVAMFGCDCPACLNSLRQLRNQPPVVSYN